MKMAEIFFLQRQALNELRTNLAVMESELTTAQLNAEAIQGQLDLLKENNAWMQQAIEQWRTDQQALAENYDNQLRLERKKRLKQILMFTAGGIVAGVVIGIVAK